MFKWWFLLVFLPNFRMSLIVLIALIIAFIIYFAIEFADRFDFKDKVERCFEIKKVFKNSIIIMVILMFIVSILPSTEELIKMFTANTILTKENTELISKIPNEGLRYLDKIIQERLNEIDKKGK